MRSNNPTTPSTLHGRERGHKHCRAGWETKGAYANPNLHIGARHYLVCFSSLCRRATAAEHRADNRKGIALCRLYESLRLQGREPIALAVLFAGKLVNKLLHALLSRMRVARVRLDAAEDGVLGTGRLAKTVIST